MKTTAREYLIGKGLAKPGRGKFSNVAKEELAKAIDAGTEFSDYTIAGRTGKTEEQSYEIAPMTWPNGRAVVKETGKKISMKNACNGCGFSLNWCECPQPTVNMKEVVIFPN